MKDNRNNNMLVYCKYPSNHVVTNYYMDIIKEAFVYSGYKVKTYNKEDLNIDKNAIFIVSNPLEQLQLYLKGCRNFVTWSQGVVPEESYMKHKSWIRWKVISLIDKFAFKRCKVLLLVSQYQKEFYENKYKLNLSDKSYVMPCYNCEIEKDAFNNINKKNKNIFVFAGSCVTIWQYFEETMKYYKKIETKYADKVELLILTKDKKYAESILEKYKIKNFNIDYVSVENLPSKLSDCKFGLLLRKDNIVNNVATPTKLSTYLSCGLIPIVSSSIKDFARDMKGRRNFIVVDDEEDISLVESYINEESNIYELYNDISNYWNEHYNTKKHINEISKLILSKFSR